MLKGVVILFAGLHAGKCSLQTGEQVLKRVDHILGWLFHAAAFAAFGNMGENLFELTADFDGIDLHLFKDLSSPGFFVLEH